MNKLLFSLMLFALMTVAQTELPVSGADHVPDFAVQILDSEFSGESDGWDPQSPSITNNYLSPIFPCTASKTPELFNVEILKSGYYSHSARAPPAAV